MGRVERGAENLLPVRTAIMSRTSDQLWDCVHKSPPILKRTLRGTGIDVAEDQSYNVGFVDPG